MTVPEPATAVSVRTAVRADLLDVLRIERDAFPQPWPYAAFDRFLGEPGFLVADGSGRLQDELGSGDDLDEFESGGRDPDVPGTEGGGPPDVLGYVVADSVPGQGSALGHVKDLAVREDRRREGIGATLLGNALKVLDGQGAGSVKLEVRRGNDRARELYDAFGFELLRTVRGYYEDGEDALVLVREL